MPRVTAGILLYRVGPRGPEVLLVHMGGPFWAKKDAAAWSIPKEIADPDEAPSITARREFTEETGGVAPADMVPLGEFRQSGGKTLVAFAAEGDFDPAGFRSNTFTMEWPPRSGKVAEFPEADRAGWFELGQAAEKITAGQRPLIAALAALLDGKA